MAESTEGSVSSWPGFVDQLNKTFMLIRDAFGYALPGAIFLGIGLISGRYSMTDVCRLLSPYTVPPWMAFLGIVIISYAVGSVLAAVTYSPFMVLKFFVWWWDWHFPLTISSPPPTLPGWSGFWTRTGFWQFCRTLRVRIHLWLVTKWLGEHPTEVSKESLKIRIQHPKLIDTLDRRETLNLLSASLTGSLLAGWFVFYKARLGFRTILFWGATFALLQFLTGLPHLRRVAKSTCEAHEELEKTDNHEPDNFADSLKDLIKAAQKMIAALMPGSPP